MYAMRMCAYTALPPRDLMPPVSMTHSFFVQQEAAGVIDSELAVVLSSVATACKQISSLVSRSGISGMTGLAGAANIQVRTP